MRSCPYCKSENVATERKPNGNSICQVCQLRAPTAQFDDHSLYEKMKTKPEDPPREYKNCYDFRHKHSSEMIAVSDLKSAIKAFEQVGIIRFELILREIK